MAKIKKYGSDSHKARPRGINRHAFERVYWPYIPIVLAISLLLVAGGRGGALQAAYHHPFGKVLSYSTSMGIDALLSDTNSQRSANGVAGLSLNSKLDAAAQAKADDMATRNYWSHYTPEGNPPWIFVNDQSYSYQKLGENLATGFSDEQSTINGWMASPPHRENLLNPAFSEVGFGYANNPDYTAAGGGPMTIVVAFYGQPQVLGASTTAAASPANSPPAAVVPNTPAPKSSTAPVAPIEAQPATPTKQPATTATPKKNLVSPVKTSHIQLAAPKLGYGALITSLSIITALGLGGFWLSRHLRALKKFLLNGERYAIGHPLTDLGLAMIAALLFILSQTAGLIQ